MERKNIPKLALCSVAVAMLMTVTVNRAAAGENREFETQRLSMLQKIEQRLISNGLCSSKADCQQKQLFFATPGRRGIAIITYAVNSPPALQSIVEIAAETFYQDKVTRIEIVNYSYSKKEELHSLFKPGPAISAVIFER